MDLWFLHGPVPGAHRPADLLDPVLDLYARPGIPHLHLLLPQLQGAPSSPFLLRLCDCVQQLTAGSSVNPGHW